MKAAAFILLGLATAGGQTASAQSLGEVAQKEKAKRELKTQSVQRSTKTVRVYTQNDIKEAVPAYDTGEVEGESAKDAAVATDAGTITVGTAAPDPQETLKQQWRTKADAIRTELAVAEADLRAMEALAPGFTIEPDGLLQARARAASVKQRLAQLEEDARRQGVPPGWMR